MNNQEKAEQERQYKTPIYIRNAKRNYHQRKVASDPEYAKKIRSNNREWHKKKREEDGEFNERYRNKNLEASHKRIEEYLKTYVSGDELFNLINEFVNYAESKVELSQDNLLALVRSTSCTLINEKPLYLSLRDNHPRRRIKNICIGILFHVLKLSNQQITMSDIVACYGIAFSTISDIVADIKRLLC